MNNKFLQILFFCGIGLLGIFTAYKMIYIPNQVELVGLIGLLLIIPILRFPIIGLYAAFLIAPFIPFIRRLYYLIHGRPKIDPLIMLTDVLVIVVFVGLFFEIRENIKNNKDSKNGHFGLIAIYILYLVLRTFVFNINPMSDSIAKLKFYAPSVFLFFIGYIYSQRFAYIKSLWIITILLAIASAAYGLKQLYFGYSAAEKIWFSSINFTSLFIKGFARPFSYYQAPAAFADYLIIAIIGLLMISEWGRIKSKLLFFVILPLLGYGILITSVRSNWIGAATVFFFWYLFLKVKTTRNKIILLFVMAGLFYGYQIVDDVYLSSGSRSMQSSSQTESADQSYVNLLVTSRASAVTNPLQEYSMLSRMTLWKFLVTSSFSLEHGLLGRGLGTLNADSLYFTYLAEFGYPGLFFILFIIFVFIRQGFTMLSTVKDKRALILTKGILVMNLVLAIMNATGSHIHSFPGDMYFWFFNGVLMNMQFIDAALCKQATLTNSPLKQVPQS